VVCLLPELHEAAWAGELEPHRRRARRCAQQCTATDQAARAQRARAHRHVRLTPADHPGMTTLPAELPSPTAARLWTAIDTLASQYLRARPGQPIGAARADALTDLISAHATITTTLELHAPIDCDTTPHHPTPGGTPGGTPSGAPGGTHQEPVTGGQLHTTGQRTWFVAGPATAPGTDALLPADIVALLNDPDLTLRLARTDSYTGATRWQDPTTYRPRARTARAVRTRDGTCRFPGCATPAHRCQLDHIQPHPTGPTTVTNLQTLCTTHHGFKHHAGWTVTMTPEGICTWTTPHGRTHTTMPYPRHDTHIT
jgi:hypothetical protein